MCVAFLGEVGATHPLAAPGVMQFVMAINMHRADPEIADKVAQLQSKFMPTFQMPPPPGAQ